MERYTDAETESLATYIVEAKQKGLSIKDGIERFIEETKSERTLHALRFHWSNNVKDNPDYKHVMDILGEIAKQKESRKKEPSISRFSERRHHSIVRPFIQHDVQSDDVQLDMPMSDDISANDISSEVSNERILMTQNQFVQFVSENISIVSNIEASLIRENELVKKQLTDCRNQMIELIAKNESLSLEKSKLQSDIEVLKVKLDNAVEDRDAVMTVISRAREFTVKEDLDVDTVSYKVSKDGVVEKIRN